MSANQPQTTYAVIEQREELHPEKPALVFLEDGTVAGGARRWSYRELRDEVVEKDLTV